MFTYLNTQGNTMTTRTPIEVIKLPSGTRLVRPQHSFGTCGFFPKAWQAGVMDETDTMASAFLKSNKNWMLSDIVS
jgi:hypothetical protein